MDFKNKSILNLGNIYFSIALVLFGGSAVYGTMQYKFVFAESQAVVENGATRDAIQNELKIEKEAFQKFAEERAKKQSDYMKKISSILPPDENYTDLARTLDDYFAQNDTPDNPIFESSLRFGKGAPVSGSQDISSLPISMNLEGTRANFFKFLNFINSSGSLETGIRLMEINSIQLNFPEGGEVISNPKQRINFTVDMNAYYETPKVAR